MLSKEEFEKLINNLRDKLDETTVALVSEEILATLSAYNNGFDEYEKSVEEVEKFKELVLIKKKKKMTNLKMMKRKKKSKLKMSLMRKEI